MHFLSRDVFQGFVYEILLFIETQKKTRVFFVHTAKFVVIDQITVIYKYEQKQLIVMTFL